jgi:hypothetical protein
MTLRPKLIYALLALVLTILAACTKEFDGDRNTSDAPQTYALVDSVVRDANNYLTTTVTAHWWAESKTGFITGYEVSTDNMQTWRYTTKQSGSFLLDLPLGVKEGLLPIFIRAIDNSGKKDPTPAQMVFPVRNTAPRVVIDPIANKRPFNTFPIIRALWNVTDIDGIQDISYYELVMNDTTLNHLNLPANFTIEPVNDSSALAAVRMEAIISNNIFSEDFKVFTGNRTTPVAGTLLGAQYNDTNRLYIRAVDRTGNKSAWAVDLFFLKKPVSDVLLVNALTASANATQLFYTNNLSSPIVNITQFESMVGITTSNRTDDFYSDALTQSRTFSLFKKIIWLTDEPNTLNTIQQGTADFFANNGRMFIYIQFPDEYPRYSSSLNFTPIESIVIDSASGKFRINSGSEAFGPVSWPTLKSSSIFNVRPFNTYSINTGLFAYDTLMHANLTIQRNTGAGPWNGISTVMSKRIRVNTQKADLIITTLPLQSLNANNNIDSLFKKVFIDELSF